jgi:Flp pilus assembly protein TadB
MDIYTISFIISTLWVGPFWIAMLLNPKKEKTKKLLKEPLFFIGPIIIWFLIMFLNPQGLADLFNNPDGSSGILDAIGSALGTPAGVAGTWAHMVVGDIFVTRWIWKRSIDSNQKLWTTRLSIFFGVILMPLGLAIHTIASSRKKQEI